ncbi:FAD-binding oxidoreductase [Kitasatospora gansuensis]
MTLPAQRSGPDAEWGGPDQLCYGPPAADPLRPTRPTRPVTAAPAGLAEFAARATALLGAGRVLADRTSLGLHSYDASLEVRQPGLVLIPRHAADLAALVTDAARIGVPWVMRGAGTGYSGGALAEHGGAVVLTRDLNRILEIDPDRRLVRCEPGVVLGDLREALRPYGLRYLPDPSSYQVCTLGGNVAENAGGPHALGSGPTSNFVVGLDLILPDGSPATLTEADVWQGGLDLRSLLVGSEGTLGAVGAMTLRVVPEPECSQVLIARFEEQDPAAATVEVLLAGGLLPSALDMITGAYVPDRPALRDPSLLFIALEGTTAEVRHQAAVAEAAVAAAGGSSELLAVDAFMAVRARLVKEKVRRMVTTGGRPCYYLFDAVVPRSGLKKLMGALRRRADQHGFPLLNTFHAADGNVHPTPFYDPADPGYRDGLLAFLRDVLSDCAELGGSLSGEHGVGLEKREHMPLFHTERELTVMRRIKAAVDPGQVCNPGKILPEPAPEGAPHRIGRRHPDPQGGAALRVRVADGAIDVRDRRVTFGEIDRALAYPVSSCRTNRWAPDRTPRSWTPWTGAGPPCANR